MSMTSWETHQGEDQPNQAVIDSNDGLIQGGTNGIEAEDSVWIRSNDGTIRGGSEGSGDDGDHWVDAHFGYFRDR